MTSRNAGFFRYKKAFTSSLFMATFFFLWAASHPAQGQSRLKVVTTLFPLQEFAKAVGGEIIQVDILLPPGTEPHAWEPKPSDLAKITQADVFIYIGRAMEPWVEDLLKASQGSRLKVVEASRGLPLLEAKGSKPASQLSHDQVRSGKADPHVWLDFSLDLKIVDSIAAIFAEKDPNQASKYRANAEVYKAKLDALDKKYQALLSPCRHRQIILGGHSAFSYLAKRYGLEQIPLYGVSPNAEPTPKKLAEVITAAKSHGVRFIFFEELVNPKLAQVLAKEAGLQTLVLNDGANLTREQGKQQVSFLGLMEKNLENLRRGLDCEPH